MIEWVIRAAASMYLIIWAIEQARHMSSKTCHRIRLGVVLIGASAMGALISPFYAVEPRWLLASVMVGASLLFWADRRRRLP